MGLARIFTLFLFRILPAATALLIAGCAAHRPYHAFKSPGDARWRPVAAVDTEISDGEKKGSYVYGARDHCSPADASASKGQATAAIERTHYDGELLYTLGFVDVDDQGHFWSEEQVTYVVEELTGVSSDGAPPEKREPSIFVLYVPGWTHSGWTCDTHVRNYRRTLEMAAKKEAAAAALAGRPKREVRGLYFAWRGQGDFLGRKAAADRAGRSAGITLLARLGPFLRELRDDEGSTSILIGQSLGAAVLNETVAAHFLTELAEVRGGSRKAVLGPADLVVYLNPAFEESRFSQINTMWQDALEAGQVQPEQTTQLIVYQTKGDRATGALFPVFAPLSPTGQVTAGGDGGTRYNAIGTRAARAAEDPREQFGCVRSESNADSQDEALSSPGFYARTSSWIQPSNARMRSDERATVHCGWRDGLPYYGDGRLFRYAWDEGRVRVSYGHSDVFSGALISWVWETAGSLRPPSVSLDEDPPESSMAHREGAGQRL